MMGKRWQISVLSVVLFFSTSFSFFSPSLPFSALFSSFSHARLGAFPSLLSCAVGVDDVRYTMCCASAVSSPCCCSCRPFLLHLACTWIFCNMCSEAHCLKFSMIDDSFFSFSRCAWPVIGFPAVGGKGPQSHRFDRHCLPVTMPSRHTLPSLSPSNDMEAKETEHHHQSTAPRQSSSTSEQFHYTRTSALYNSPYHTPHPSSLPHPSLSFSGKHPFRVSLSPPAFSNIISTHSSPSLHGGPSPHAFFSSSFRRSRSSFSCFRFAFSSSFRCLASSLHCLRSSWSVMVSQSGGGGGLFSTGGRGVGGMTGPGVLKGSGCGLGSRRGGGVSSPKPQRSWKEMDVSLAVGPRGGDAVSDVTVREGLQ
ncbi:hypothetical protein BKA80DRAFT_795 [Phyllosticta citrichinensis]